MSDISKQKSDHRDEPVRGADANPAERPGVPMERQPGPLTPTTHWREPARQKPVRGVTKRAELSELTPVFSAAHRPRLLSGAMRRHAYTLPEVKARRWLTLLVADRVDMWERRVGKLVKYVAVPAAIYFAARALRNA